MEKRGNFIKLNDDATTRINMDAVLGYTVVLTADSESIVFALNVAKDDGTLVTKTVAYTDADTEDEQVRADANYLDFLTGASRNTRPASTDQST